VKGDTGGAYERSETGVVHYNTQLFISSGREIRYDVGASEGAQADIDLVRHTACFRAAEGRHQNIDNPHDSFYIFPQPNFNRPQRRLFTWGCVPHRPRVYPCGNPA